MRLLEQLYYETLRIRRVEERIAELYAEQQMRCPVHLSVGQEAIAAGVCAALRRSDWVFSNHRSHAHYLAKGGDLKAMLAELYGKATGCCLGRGGSMHLVDTAAGFQGAAPIVGSTIAIAVGAAFGAMLQNLGSVTVVFFGDGATEEGVFHEALNFASLKKLPVLFACENNFYSVYSPLSVRQPANRNLALLVQGHGIETFAGDGNDALAVYRLADAAARKARGGGGPTFCEFQTARWREHCGPNYDNHLGYRSEAEFRYWKDLCPVARLRRELMRQGLAAAALDEMAHEIDAEIELAVSFARQSPFPAEEPAPLDAVYAPCRAQGSHQSCGNAPPVLARDGEQAMTAL